MTFDEYQKLAQETDQNSGKSERELIIPLLGLAGETGTLLTEYKKLMRDGPAHAHFNEMVSEDLGDILWYVTNVASKCGLSLSRIAERNIEKTRKRFLEPESAVDLFDDDCKPEEQLPREFVYTLAYREVNGAPKVALLDRNGEKVGDALTDNAYEEDGYRFHDVFHFAYAAILGWSPITRGILKRKRKSDNAKDEVEDGGRAGVIEEGITASVFEYATRHNLFEGVTRVDWQLLLGIQRLTGNLEVRRRTAAEWEKAILIGFEVWRKVRQNNGGTVKGDLRKHSLEFVGK
jgi:NTP pyrophosphatase (non-canonical NTP hydrolase)